MQAWRLGRTREQKGGRTDAQGRYLRAGPSGPAEGDAGETL